MFSPKRLGASAAAIALSCGMAQAADFGLRGSAYDEPNVVEPAFGGPFVGIIGGYTWGEAEFSSPLVPDVTLTDDLDGPDAGLSIGYDLFSDSVFSGIELVGAMGGPEKDYEFGPYDLTYGIDAHVDARIRAGFEVGDMVALYAIGGASYARTHVEVEGGGLKREEEDWRLGWIAGAGAEVLVARNVSLGAEYTYNHLPKETYFGVLDVAGHYHAARAALRLRF